MVMEHKKEANNCFTVNHLSQKNKKMKKVPQRGLGVAQLEKIRMEEQNDKNNSTTSSPLFPAITNPLPLPLPLPPPKQKQPSSPFPLSQPSVTFNSGSTITMMDTSNQIERFSTSRFVLQPYNSSLNHNRQDFPNITSAKNTILQPSSSSGVVHHHRIEPPSNQIYHSNNVFFRTEEGKNLSSTSATTTVFDPLSMANFTITHPYLLKPDDQATLIMHTNDPMNFEPSFSERASTSGAAHEVDLKNSCIGINGKHQVDWRKKRPCRNSSSSMDLTIQHDRELRDFMPSPEYGTEDLQQQQQQQQQRFFNFIPVPPTTATCEPANNGSPPNFLQPPREPEAFEYLDTTLKLREPQAFEDVDTKLKL